MAEPLILFLCITWSFDDEKLLLQALAKVQVLKEAQAVEQMVYNACKANYYKQA